MATQYQTSLALFEMSPSAQEREDRTMPEDGRCNRNKIVSHLAVHENYRRPSGNGLGVALLSAAEERAQALGANELFVLTTQTTDWFRDHGFVDAKTDVLPDEKQSLYNWQRGSKVMVKAI